FAALGGAQRTDGWRLRCPPRGRSAPERTRPPAPAGEDPRPRLTRKGARRWSCIVQPQAPGNKEGCPSERAPAAAGEDGPREDERPAPMVGGTLHRHDEEIPMTPKSPVPPFTRESALQKVQAAEDAWNTCDPVTVSRAYTLDTVWRN